MKKFSIDRRILALVLAFGLVTGLFAGCNQNAAAEDPTTVPQVTDPEELPLRFTLPAGNIVDTELAQEQKLDSHVSRALGYETPKAYTILVYIVGSNLESDYGCASDDIREMMNSGLDTANCNVLIYTGGSASWDLEIPSDVNTVWRLDNETGELVAVGATSQAANMGSAATLLDFLCFGYNYYPASNYGLILWDHGGGPLGGFGCDELFSYDGLSLAEMEDAMAESPFAEEKLVFVGFDACLMASLEVANLFSDYADYLIASEEVEPGSGWDYSFLEILNDTTDPLALGEAVLDTYRDSMEASRWDPEYSLSMLDLTVLPELNAAMDVLYVELAAGIDDGEYARIAKWRNDTKRFGLDSASSLSSSYDLVDVGDMLQNMRGSYTDEAGDALEILDEFVVAQVTNIEGANGVTMYYPYDNKTQFRRDGSDLYADFMDTDGYGVFVDAFTEVWLEGTSGVRLMPEQTVETTGEYLTLTLEPEQLENIGTVTYSILRYDEQNGTYSVILSNFTAQPDENGVVQIPRNPDIFVLQTDMDALWDEAGSIWPVSLMESGGTQNSYASLNTQLLANMDMIYGGTETIQINLAEDLTTGEVTIENILSRNSDIEFYGKQDVDIDNWGVISYNADRRYVTYDANGELLPWDEWQSDGWFVYYYNNYEEYFELYTSPLQEQEGIFYCQVVVTDNRGNVVGVRLEELYQNTPYTETSQTMAEGTMYFRVYEDHAVVTAFEAKENEESYEYLQHHVTVPAYVSGKPVTVIGNYAFGGCMELVSVTLPDTVQEIEYEAFSGCFYLTSVNIPASVKYIGNGAFGNTGLTELTLPEGLEVISYQAFAATELTTVHLPASLRMLGSGAFGNCEFLTEITVSPDNENYQSIDGVLYNADGTELLAYPAGAGESYAIPEGVVTVGDEAFRGNELLTSVTFPESLQHIGQLAFGDTLNLTRIDLPAGLQTIGGAAFGGTIGSEPCVELTISIGPNVRWIGADAFSGYLVTAFQVDSGNEYYSAANGCLLNKTGTRMIQAPYGHTGKLTVPSGVGYIDWNAFDSCESITELVLPDSVVSISHAAGMPTNLQKLTVGAGMANWRGWSYYYEIPEIVISANNPNYTMVDGSIYSKDMTVLYLCRSTAEEFRIPEGVTTIASTSVFFSDYAQPDVLKRIYIPASLTEIPEGAFRNLMWLESIEVDPANPVYASHDGLLYSKDGTVLYACPLGKTGTVTVRDGTVEIAENAFYYGGYLQAETVIIPEGVTVLRKGNFSSNNYSVVLQLHLPGSLTDINPEIFTYVDPGEIVVHCPAGSAAEAAAEDMGMTVIN